MSLKSVEMQIALPRTQDAGKMQNELNGRAQAMNAHAHIAVEKDDQLKRKTVTENHESARMKAKKEGNDQNHPFADGRKDQRDKGEKGNLEHPYKGKFIDYKG